MTKIIKIGGMSCGHCSARVEKALSALGDIKVSVDLKAGTATVGERKHSGRCGAPRRSRRFGLRLPFDRKRVKFTISTQKSQPVCGIRHVT